VLYKFSIFYDVEYDLYLCVRVVVFHPSRCELTMVRFDVVVWNGGDGWNPSGDVVSHARIC
jgi:hypothetical protein